MKLKRLLARLDEFLNAKERQRREDAKAIKKVLGDLKRKERKLKADVAKEQDPVEAEALESKLKVVHAQRQKGLAALKANKKNA